MNQKLSKGVVLVSLLILPFLVYFIFVYSAEENFFVKLDYVGPKEARQVEVNGKTQWDTTYYTIPDFALTSQNDTLVSADQLRGQIYVVNFFFSTCPSICPAMNFQLKQVQDRFTGYDDFKIVSISVDPKHDTVEVLKAYEATIGAIDGRWHFLTGDQDRIYQIAEGFFSNAMVDEEADGGFLHSENLVLVDWDGHIRSGRDEYGNIKGVYNSLSTVEVNKLKDDIKVLIAEYEKKKSVDAYQMEKQEKKTKQNG